jgi:uncharacterized membrane protein YkgB
MATFAIKIIFTHKLNNLTDHPFPKATAFQGDLDYKLIRASMVIIYFFFGYQKWFDYEMQGLIPFFTHGPLIFWMYSVFGIRARRICWGVSEWLFGALILAGFWNKKLGALGALGSVLTFFTTVTIMPLSHVRVGTVLKPLEPDTGNGRILIDEIASPPDRGM